MGAAETSSSGAASPRRSLVEELASILTGSRPRAGIIHAPRGWGKAAILDDAARRAGAQPVARIDLARCVTNPDEFACAFASALMESALSPDETASVRPAGSATPAARLRGLAASCPVQALPETGALAAALVAEMSRRFGAGRAVVDLALAVPAALATDLGRNVGIVARGFDEVLRLVPFPGLDDAAERIARAVGANGSLRLLASTSPAGRPRPLFDALRSALGSDVVVRAAPPLVESEVSDRLGAAVEGAARLLLSLTSGRPLAVNLLEPRLAAGEKVEAALASEMAPGSGLLFQELRYDYLLLIERTRGHAASRAILNVVAREEGLDLSGIASRLRRSAGSTLDYLRWLLEVDLLRRDGRRYVFADPLLRLYVLLHEAPERPATEAARRDLIERFIAALGAERLPLRPRGRPRGRRSAPAPAGRIGSHPSQAAASSSHARRTAVPQPGSSGAPAADPEVRPDQPPRRDDSLMEID